MFLLTFFTVNPRHFCALAGSEDSFSTFLHVQCKLVLRFVSSLSYTGFSCALLWSLVFLVGMIMPSPYLPNTQLHTFYGHFLLYSFGVLGTSLFFQG